MSDFAQLKCFNKLLLQKMQRMEKQMKKLETENLNLSNEKKEYRSLMDCVDLDDVRKCWDCDLWYDDDDLVEVGDAYICERCYDEKNYYRCDNCGEDYCEDEMKKMKEGHIDNVCNKCYKGYIIHEIDNGIDGLNDSDLINEMVYNKNKVMEELLKKVKTN